MRNLIYILTFLIGHVSVAQTGATRTLDFSTFLAMVKDNHPLAVQADLRLSRGEAELLKSKGGFDPKAFTDLSQKYFDDKTYYSNGQGGLKIPTWFAIDIEGGYQQNEGIFLNPENNVPATGLAYLGVSVPLGQGLIIDQRRAQYRKARLYQQSTVVERQILLNELLYDAGKTYWDWFTAYNAQLVYEDALELAIVRFNAVKQSAFLGDRPYIDTLEAGIQVQNRQLSLQQARLDFLNTTLYLSVFLWSDGEVPLELEEGTTPLLTTNLTAIDAEEIYLQPMDSLIQAHPELQLYNFKIGQLKVEQKWKREQLKPTLNLKYNAISEPINNDPISNYTINDYNWGLQFSIPIFLRKERGDLRLAKLKIQETELDVDNKRQTIISKAQSALNQWQTTFGQMNLYQQTVEDYEGLLNGERNLFNSGESSLFMVNSRELGFINAQLTLIKLAAENQKSRLTLNYALGTMTTL